MDKPKKLDGVLGFFTSKRGIGLIIGAIFMALGAFTPVDIDIELRKKFIDGVFWLTSTFVGGVSLSDAFGKGKVAEEIRGKLAGLLKTGIEIAGDVAGDIKDAKAKKEGAEAAPGNTA